MSDESTAAASGADSIDRLARVYLLRLYRESLRAQRSLRSWLTDRGPLAEALGLEEPAIKRWGRERLAEAVSRCLTEFEGVPQGGPLRAAIGEFGREVGLSERECEVLLFAVVAAKNETLGGLSSTELAGSCRMFNSLVAVATGIALPDVRDAMAPAGLLFRTGLLRAGSLFCDDLSERLQLLDGLADSLLEGRTHALLQDKLPRAAAPAIGLDDAAWLRDELATAIAVLKGAIETRARGVQVLLYGEPGVGKTELARLIARETGFPAYTLPDSNDAGDPLDAEQRLRRFALMQRLLLRSRRTVLIFDEIEDMLASSEQWGWVTEGGKPPVGSLKAWKNRLLEETEIPSIWIANWLHAVDPALLRRFTLAIKVPPPPMRARRAMLDRQAGEYLRDARVRDLVAELRDITPADIARARRATELAQPSLGRPAADCFLRVLSMRADRDGLRLRIRAPAPDLPYRIDWLNTDPPVADIVRLLENRGAGRLCFSGPPGTGKTALAQHLARALDRPLHAKKASDLLSCFLGETEKHLCEAFEAAERENAVLLLDEADTFLRGREYATRSWEVSQVNQLLKELEAFDGVVALCTNTFDVLDAAVLRRLDLKVAFERLPAGSAQEAFLAAAAALCVDGAEAATVLAARPLPRGEFALGDIAVAMRQVQLRADVPSAALLRECLEAERRARLEREGRAIGFLA